MIISLSGHNGTGKTSNVELLKNKLCCKYKFKGISILNINNSLDTYEDTNTLHQIYDKVKNFDVITSRFYLKSFSTHQLHKKIMFGNMRNIFKNTELTKTMNRLVFEDSLKLWDIVINKLLIKGKILIFDRYYYDEIAYRALYGIDICEIEKLYANWAVPDLPIYLDASLNIIKERNVNRINNKSALFKNSNKLLALDNNFNYIKAKFNMVEIDTSSKSLQSVSNNIFSIVDAKITSFM